MTNLKTFCVTNVSNKNLELLDIDLVGVGQNKFSNKYIKCDNQINIQHKEKFYSELTFHYWFWKNKMNEFDNDTWIAFCQKRRFWIKDHNSTVHTIDELYKNLLREIPSKFNTFDAIICSPIKVSPAKPIKLLKRGWKNWIRDPSIIIDKRKHNLKLQFDMFHGYGKIQKAANLLPEPENNKFIKYLDTKTEFNPNIMVISKKKILEKWFKDVFEWLENCEKIFGFKNLQGYDTGRLYAYLAERYLSFWFNSKCNSTTGPWTFFDTTK